MPKTFTKTVPSDRPNPFPSEAFGLETLGATGVARVPAVLRHGSSHEHHFLVLEHLDLAPRISPDFGNALRALHAHTSPDGRYGFPRDNFIGGSLQPNRWETSWATFFVEHRFDHQLRLAADAGFRFREKRALLRAANNLLAGYQPVPALLHGDLWSGNAHCMADGSPVFYDPAPYYGDAETDLAFTKLFGGFPGEFYGSHPAERPDLHGLYNLYHLLNHLVIFGRSYLPEVEAGMQRLLRTDRI